MCGIVDTVPHHGMRAGMDNKTFAWHCFSKVGKVLAEINFPLHTIPFLLFKLKTFRSVGLIKLFTKLIIGYIRSVMFMTCFINTPRVTQQISAMFPKAQRPNFEWSNKIGMFIGAANMIWEQEH